MKVEDLVDLQVEIFLKVLVSGGAAKGGFDAVGAFENAISLDGNRLSEAGRAVLKHPKYFGFESPQALQQVYRSDKSLNNLGSSRLKDVLRNGIMTTGAGGCYPWRMGYIYFTEWKCGKLVF